MRIPLEPSPRQCQRYFEMAVLGREDNSGTMTASGVGGNALFFGRIKTGYGFCACSMSD